MPPAASSPGTSVYRICRQHNAVPFYFLLVLLTDSANPGPLFGDHVNDGQPGPVDWPENAKSTRRNGHVFFLLSKTTTYSRFVRRSSLELTRASRHTDAPSVRLESIDGCLSRIIDTSSAEKQYPGTCLNRSLRAVTTYEYEQAPFGSMFLYRLTKATSLLLHMHVRPCTCSHTGTRSVEEYLVLFWPHSHRRGRLVLTAIKPGSGDGLCTLQAASCNESPVDGRSGLTPPSCWLVDMCRSFRASFSLFRRLIEYLYSSGHLRRTKHPRRRSAVDGYSASICPGTTGWCEPCQIQVHGHGRAGDVVATRKHQPDRYMLVLFGSWN